MDIVNSNQSPSQRVLKGLIQFFNIEFLSDM